VTPQRSAYQANRGYSGWSSLISASQRFDRMWLGAFIRYDNLQGTGFQDSPLVETRHALLAGIGLAWVFQPRAQP
jgi:outer membrane scaffolding protein for murein synthesis (MipA/OmpV family)